MAHRGVVGLGEQEHDPGVAQDLGLGRGGHVEGDAERLEHVGAARAAAGGAVSVFRHGHACRRGDQRSSRGKIQCSGMVAAGAAGVQDALEPVIDADHRLTHRARRGRDRLRAFAHQPQRHQEPRDLRRGPAPRQDRGEHPLHPRVGRERAVVSSANTSENSERGVGHNEFNQFPMSCEPCCVRTDSGWNCTPSTGSDLRGGAP